jgi:hypothetical protein
VCPARGTTGPEQNLSLAVCPRRQDLRTGSQTFPRYCAPRENSRRAQQGHTKCGKASYGQPWANMATKPCTARTFTTVLWLGWVGYGLRIVVHTGEVQGSIPCAPTTSPSGIKTLNRRGDWVSMLAAMAGVAAVRTRPAHRRSDAQQHDSHDDAGEKIAHQDLPCDCLDQRHPGLACMPVQPHAAKFIIGPRPRDPLAHSSPCR